MLFSFLALASARNENTKMLKYRSAEGERHKRVSRINKENQR
jgi:hypothetical protein